MDCLPLDIKGSTVLLDESILKVLLFVLLTECWMTDHQIMTSSSLLFNTPPVYKILLNNNKHHPISIVNVLTNE